MNSLAKQLVDAVIAGRVWDAVTISAEMMTLSHEYDDCRKERRIEIEQILGQLSFDNAATLSDRIYHLVDRNAAQDPIGAVEALETIRKLSAKADATVGERWLTSLTAQIRRKHRPTRYQRE